MTKALREMFLNNRFSGVIQVYKKINRKCVVVMTTILYHSMLLDKTPTASETIYGN